MVSASASKKHRVSAEVGAVPGCTKHALVQILRRLHSQGVLDGEIAECGASGVKKRMHKPLEELHSVQTPYGPLFRHMHIGLPRLPTIEIVNPMAYLHYMSSLSNNFAELLVNASESGNRELRIVFYLDTIAPGNPLRPEKSRTTECLYWTIIDFPTMC